MAPARTRQVARMNKDWEQLSIGERIVRAAWMAVHEHLAHDAAPPGPVDQASRLRSLMRLRQLELDKSPKGGRE